MAGQPACGRSAMQLSESQGEAGRGQDAGTHTETEDARGCT